MAASNLLSSAFATPGRRAHGSLGTLPAGFTWGDEVWGALNIAEHVETSAPFHTKIRAPCFGMGTVKVTGQPKGVTALFQALAFVHTGERPDIVVVLGRWCVHRPWLTEYYGKKLTAAQLRKANEHADGWWLADWPDAIGLRDFEGMQRVAIRGAPDPGVGLVAGDVDAHPLNGVVHRDPTKSWRLIVTDAEASGLASLAELDALLPAVNLPPPLLLPPSGIPPAADVLERIDEDVYLLDGRPICIGAAPGGPLPAFVYGAGGEMGQLLERPAAGSATLRVRRIHSVAASAVVAALGALGTTTWGSGGDAEVVLSDETISVPITAVPRPVTTVIVVPAPAFHVFSTCVPADTTCVPCLGEAVRALRGAFASESFALWRAELGCGAGSAWAVRARLTTSARFFLDFSQEAKSLCKILRDDRQFWCKTNLQFFRTLSLGLRRRVPQGVRQLRPDTMRAIRAALLQPLPALGDVCLQRAMVDTMVRPLRRLLCLWLRRRLLLLLLG